MNEAVDPNMVYIWLVAINSVAVVAAACHCHPLCSLQMTLLTGS